MPQTPRRVGRSSTPVKRSGSQCGRCRSHSGGVTRGRSPRGVQPSARELLRATDPQKRPKWIDPHRPTKPLPPRMVGRHKTMDPDWAIEHEVLNKETYPNWTLDDEDKNVKHLPPHKHHLPANTGSPRLPRAERQDKGQYDSTVNSSQYPNWTLRDNQGSPRTPRSGRNHWNKNDDIEGSKPAIAKFRKGNRKIIADPYPDRLAAPVPGGYNKEKTNTITPWTDKHKSHIDASGKALPNDTKQLYNIHEGTLRTKEVEVFKSGVYSTAEVLMRHTPGRGRDFNILSHESPTPVSHVRNRSVGRVSSSLTTCDIQGARPRTYSTTPVRNRPPGPTQLPFPQGPDQSISRCTTPRREPSRGFNSITPARQSPSMSHHSMMSSQITFF